MSDAFRRTMFTLAAACAVVAARPVHAGFEAHARNFECLLEGTKPAGKNFYVFHRNRRKLARAVAIAEGGAPGETYPVGTILQLFPFEAMVKRGGRFNPEGQAGSSSSCAWTTATGRRSWRAVGARSRTSSARARDAT